MNFQSTVIVVSIINDSLLIPDAVYKSVDDP